MNKRMIELNANAIDEIADILIESETCNDVHLMGLNRIKKYVRNIFVELAKGEKD